MIYRFIIGTRGANKVEELEFRSDLEARRFATDLPGCFRVEAMTERVRVVWRDSRTEILNATEARITTARQ